MKPINTTMIQAPTAARLLACSVRTIRTLTKTGKLAHYKVGHRVFYKAEDIEKFIESCRVGT